MACSHALEWLDEHPEAKAPDFAEVRRRFYAEARLHFRYIWDGFQEHERSTVLKVASGKPMPDALRHVLSDLETRHLAETEAGVSRLFASTFQEFVKAEGGGGEGAKSSLLQRL